VQDGCILKCTYCIIPSVRPGLRSRPPEDIEAEVRRLIDNGYREIVICGIHVGHYGVDTTRGRSGREPFRLRHLLRKLDRIPGDWRMRLSSIEANEIDEDFMRTAADCEHLCPQFHPALQSGSDAVLKRMRRRYRIGRFLDQVDQFRDIIPDVALSTDVIVGFPGETDDEFEETAEACRRAEFMKIHIFPFSPRKGTPAAAYPDQVPAGIRKLRCERLAVVERELAMGYYAQHVEFPLEVLVEGVCDEAPGWVRGTDAHYMPVRMPGSPEEVGAIVGALGHTVHRDYLQAVR
jgi:threonylcarbamoyladenosine tRNA methylthiotransferase MtaB